MMTTARIWLGRLLLGAGLVSAAYIAGVLIYWQWIQPLPTFTLRAPIVVNQGRDTQGLTYDQAIARGQPFESWTPIEDHRVRAGGTFSWLRFTCYAAKTSGVVSRAFIGAGPGTSGIYFQLPDRAIPTRTVGCKRVNQLETVPAELPPGTYHFLLAVTYYANPLKPAVYVPYPLMTIEVTR